MEKAVVMGCVCVVVSSLTPEQLESAKRYAPEVLKLTDETGDVVYSLDIDKNQPGNVMKETALYSDCKSADGKATITIILDPEVEDKAQLVHDSLGADLLKLDRLERQILEKMEGIEEKEKQARDLIISL